MTIFTIILRFPINLKTFKPFEITKNTNKTRSSNKSNTESLRDSRYMSEIQCPFFSRIFIFCVKSKEDTERLKQKKMITNTKPTKQIFLS